jgi:bacillithiol biosynthesis cysteine-adding enzyme BshC
LTKKASRLSGSHFVASFLQTFRSAENTSALKLTSFAYRDFPVFSRLLCDYADQNPALLSFIRSFPSLESAKEVQSDRTKSYPAGLRQAFVAELRQQHNKLEARQKENLRLLEEAETTSVSCGHQLVIGGGPMYMAFKILTTIKLAEQLSVQTGKPVVPLFWLASEDHDLEEIRSFRHFGQSYTMEVEGSGAVGRLSAKGIREQMEAIPDFPEALKNAYLSENNLAAATRNWLQHFFGPMGLLILDPDRASLKSLAWPLWEQELKSGEAEAAILADTAKLTDLGYKAQIHPRNLNLFYLKDDQRIRLERRGQRIETVEPGWSGTVEEALSHFRQHPEQLSPNVCLRPLYSQILFPDLAFVGGPAEVAYWMQLRSLFAEKQIEFPLLIPRFSANYLSASLKKKWEKIGLQVEDLKLDEVSLRRKLVQAGEWPALPNLENVFADWLSLAGATDPTLVPALKAELVRMEKSAEGMEKRIRKAAEQKEEQRLKSMQQVREKIFPNEGLQERSEGWTTWLATDPDWLTKVYECMEPLSFGFGILED